MVTNRKNIGVFIAIRKKTIIETPDNIKPEPEVILQVLFEPNIFELFSKAAPLFVKRVEEYAFNAYGFNRYGDDFKNFEKQKISEEYQYFLNNYEVVVSEQPVVFDYLIDDLTTQEEISDFVQLVEEKRGEEKNE